MEAQLSWSQPLVSSNKNRLVEYESGVIKFIVPRLLLVWLLVGKQDFEVLVHLIVFQTPAADIGLLEFIGFEQKQLSYAHK